MESGQLYMDMYGHVNACLREMTRSRALQIFKLGVRRAVAKKTEDKPITGLLDVENLTSKLKKRNITNDLVTKV